MEIETKFKTENLSIVKRRLSKLGAKFSKKISQRDEWYRWKGKELDSQKPGSFMVRIREQDDRCLLATKALTERTGAWVEYELEISNAKEMRKILNQLGLACVFTLEKKRTPGRLDEFELCLDEVKTLGNYLEVALDSNNVESAKKKIGALMSRIGISEEDAEHRGYGAIILQKMGVKYEGTNG